MYGPNNLLRLDNKCVEQLVTVTCNTCKEVTRVPVAKLSEWNFKLCVYYVKICELRSRPVVLTEKNYNSLRSIEYHQNIMNLNENAEKYSPVITQTHITKDIELVWDIMNEHLEDICGTKGVSVIWCVRDTVFSKYHRVDTALDYISIDEELLARCPIIIASYAGPRDEAMDDDVRVRDFTAVYLTDNKIFPREFAHISGGSALWVHAKCGVKKINGQFAYKQIYNHLFGRNTLGNFDAVYETTIGLLYYHAKKNSFN